MAEGLMAGKRGLIMGVANNRSIAWGIAKALHAQGAQIAFSYQGEALKKRVEPLAAEVGSDFLVECDVTNDAAMDETFRQIKERWGHLDFLVHAIGFSDKNELEGRYIETVVGQLPADDEHLGLQLHRRRQARRAADERRRFAADADLLRRGQSTCRTTTSWASPRPRSRHRCAISRSISASRASASTPSRPAPSRRSRPPAFPASATCCTGRKPTPRCAAMSISTMSARPALYLLSDLSSGVTGEIQYVDAGFNIVGMKLMDEPPRPPPTA